MRVGASPGAGALYVPAVALGQSVLKYANPPPRAMLTPKLMGARATTGPPCSSTARRGVASELPLGVSIHHTPEAPAAKYEGAAPEVAAMSAIRVGPAPVVLSARMIPALVAQKTSPPSTATPKHASSAASVTGSLPSFAVRTSCPTPWSGDGRQR